MDRRQLILRSAALAGLGAPFANALAQGSTPQFPLPGNAFIISGFPAGGMGDQVSRPLAERLRGKYAANVLVESKVGAGGRVAVEHVKRAAPDGLTVLQMVSSAMTLYPNIYKKLSYDPLADFIPVNSTVNYQLALTAGPGTPPEIKTLADYLKWAKANPKLANFGVPAMGSAPHFVGMMLQKASGTPLTAVGYRGGAPLLNDVMGGQVPVSIGVLGEVMPHIKAGKLRGLATSGAQRSPFLPDVPTFAEQGFAEIVVQEWLGWFVPAKTPPETVARLTALVRESLHVPEYVEALSKVGLAPAYQGPQEFARTIKADLERWAPVVKASGYTAEE